MSTQSEFESLFNASVDKIDMTPGSIVNAKTQPLRLYLKSEKEMVEVGLSFYFHI